MLSFKLKKITDIMVALDPVPWQGIALLDNLMIGAKLGIALLELIADRFYENHSFTVASTCIKMTKRGWM